ncbi:hypothetical protein BC829DRAFT_439801 [Chytridium lagenaria]|nr:hypothetical protein BC829DRAFT_439801 [Chytridium lagenaria]
MTGSMLQCRELQRDTLYEVTVHLSSSPIFLHIALPAAFPETAPTITVKPNVVHPWIGPGSHISGHDKLKNWNQHMSLAKIVQEIAQEFVARNPAKVNPMVGALALSNGSAGIGAGTFQAAQVGDGNVGQGGARFGQMDGPAYSANPMVRQQSPAHEPATLGPTIDFYGTGKHEVGSFITAVQELEELMNDEAAFDDFFPELPQVKEQQRARREFVAGNEALATKSVKESTITQLRSELEDEHRIFRQEHYMTSRIRSAVTESEELSESIAQSFVLGKTAVEDFVRNYRETRKVYHQRAAKLERVTRDPKLLTPS